MNNTLDFETAINLLKSIPFGDTDKFVGAIMLVSEAFDMSIDSLLDKLD